MDRNPAVKLNEVKSHEVIEMIDAGVVAGHATVASDPKPQSDPAKQMDNANEKDTAVLSRTGVSATATAPGSHIRQIEGRDEYLVGWLLIVTLQLSFTDSRR